MRSIVACCWAALIPALLPLLPPTAATADEPARPTAPASEANPAVPAAGHSLHGEAFDDGPRQRARILPGVGKVHFAVSTGSPEAQAFVDQGVAQLHSFYYFEAERSFRQAAALDPGCAMAYWGMAMANVNNAGRARGFLKEARGRAAKATARERLYLDALDAYHKEGVAEKARKQGFLNGLEAVVQEAPGDLDARAWMAMAAWQNASAGIGSRQAVDIVLDTVLQAEPMHPGAHHYRIHLWDGVKPARAERSAALFGKAAPGIAHAWHMPGHTYTELKRYADAAYQQEASARVDHEAMARDRIMPFEIHNYAHNNQWLATSLGHVGRARDAIAVARNLVEQPRDPARNGKNDGGSPQRSGRARWAEVLVRYELWDELIAADGSGALDWSDVRDERKQRAYSLGLAYAARREATRLAEQVAALRALATEEAKAAPKKDAGSAPPKYPWEHASPATLSALAELEGHQHLLKQEVGPAFEQFAKATAMRPEALARAHLSARNFGLAEASARSAAEKSPGQVPPLAALVEVLLAVGKSDDARAAYRRLEPLARHADADLPVFRRLAPAVGGWRAEPAGPEPATDDLTAGRVDLASLGPLLWSPYRAEPIAATDTAGKPWTLAEHKGRNVVVLFFLGGKCAHCMQQLQVFSKETAALGALGTDVVAVSTDRPEDARALKSNKEGIAFAMPILADPDLGLFKAYRSFDGFEGRPLHGTFLLDREGRVRFQRVSAEPFLDVDFIKSEAARVNRLVGP